MVNRLSPAFSRHLRPSAKQSANPAKPNRQEEEAVRLAMTLHVQGRLREATQLCAELLSRNPGNARAHFVAGRIALEGGDNDLAARHFKQALKESPREPLFLVALGDASPRDHETAIEHYLKALSVRPDMIAALTGLARAYAMTGRSEMALELFQKILRLEPNHGTARLDLANALASVGRMDEASLVLRDSIRQRKAVGAAYNALAKTRKFANEPPELKEILRELERDDLKSMEAINLHHAAGKILNDLKRHGEAFEHFRKANLASSENFDVDTYRLAIDGVIQAFSLEFLNSKAGLGDETELPVFIVGMPRSGTTLTEQICSSHPSVFGAGELKNLRRVMAGAGFEKNSLAEFRSALTAVTPERSRTLAAEYLRGVLKADSRVLRFTDKMPSNFELIGFIALLFPKARIIHCRRDPIDTCVSCFTTSFNEKHAYKTNLTKLGLYYREYDRLMRHWNAVLPGRIYEIGYETLIADQETESRKLIDYLGLPWDDACLHFEKNDRAVITASNWQVRQPIYTTSVKRWKNYEGKIQPLIDALGDLAQV
jgi:tetratricopeptide (TPR) repeat protein